MLIEIIKMTLLLKELYLFSCKFYSVFQKHLERYSMINDVSAMGLMMLDGLSVLLL